MTEISYAVQLVLLYNNNNDKKFGLSIHLYVKSEEHSAMQKSGAKTQQAMFKRKSPAVNVHNIPHYIHVISE